MVLYVWLPRGWRVLATPAQKPASPVALLPLWAVASPLVSSHLVNFGRKPGAGGFDRGLALLALNIVSFL